MEFDLLCNKLDLAVQSEPTIGIGQQFADAWQQALGMSFTEMSGTSTVFEGLISVTESPVHPDARRRVSADILREIAFTCSSESLERKRVCSAIDIWGQTTRWGQRAAAHLNFLMA